jgi:transcriptional regulator with XRE-family HTH domain
MIFTQPATFSGQHLSDDPSPQHPSIDEATVDVLVKLEESSPLSEQLNALTKDIGLRDVELAALAGVSRATLARWRKEGDAERPRSLDDLRAIAVLLMRTGAMRPRSVAGWLRSRNLGLDWNRPLDVLRTGTENFPLVQSAAESACAGRVPVRKIPAQKDPGRPPGSSRKSATAHPI